MGDLHARYEPVVDDEIIVAQLRDERLKNVLDAEAALEAIDSGPSGRLKDRPLNEITASRA